MVKKRTKNAISTLKNANKNRKARFDISLDTLSLTLCKNLILEGYIEYVSIKRSKKAAEIKLKSTYNNINALHTNDSPTNLKIIRKNKISVNSFAISILAKTNNKYVEKLLNIR